MNTLAPLPPLNVAAFAGGSPGSWSQPWRQYLTSLDVLARTTVGGKFISPLPGTDGSAINPQNGSPTQPWRAYWNTLDAALRTSGWIVAGLAAPLVLKPLPPTVGLSMVSIASGVLAQPWAEYFRGVDILSRAQT